MKKLLPLFSLVSGCYINDARLVNMPDNTDFSRLKEDIRRERAVCKDINENGLSRACVTRTGVMLLIKLP